MYYKLVNNAVLAYVTPSYFLQKQPIRKIDPFLRKSVKSPKKLTDPITPSPKNTTVTGRKLKIIQSLMKQNLHKEQRKKA